MKRICLIGSGNVAEAFAVALGGLHPAGRFRLGQIYARNRARGAKLARMAGCDHTDDPAQLVPADIYLISVSDTQIGAVAENLDFGNAIVAHTAGSVSLNVLSDRLSHRGVFYPLQTFTAGRRHCAYLPRNYPIRYTKFRNSSARNSTWPRFSHATLPTTCMRSHKSCSPKRACRRS